MKRKLFAALTVTLCTTTLLLTGCGSSTKNSSTDSTSAGSTVSEQIIDEASGKSPVMLNYSFLYDEATKNEVRSIMSADGIDEDTINHFMSTVTQFTGTMGPMKGAQDGYSTVDATTVFYDADHIGSTFEKELGFDDQNCRLTAYSLFHSSFGISEDSTFVYDDDSLYGDTEILKGNKNLDFSNEDMKKYTTLFANISCSDTKDQAELANTVAQTWTERGIEFTEDKKVQLMTILLQDPERKELYIGHAGVVFETENGYLLIEKLSQYTPFVAAKFDNLSDLNTYLLSEVNGFAMDGSAEPFVMLNNTPIK